MDEHVDDADHPLRERFAEVRGEHGWARYVEDNVLAAWIRPVRRPIRRVNGSEETPTG